MQFDCYCISNSNTMNKISMVIIQKHGGTSDENAHKGPVSSLEPPEIPTPLFLCSEFSIALESCCDPRPPSRNGDGELFLSLSFNVTSVVFACVRELPPWKNIFVSIYNDIRYKYFFFFFFFFVFFFFFNFLFVFF